MERGQLYIEMLTRIRDLEEELEGSANFKLPQKEDKYANGKNFEEMEEGST